MDKLKVILIDDHQLIIDGIRSLLNASEKIEVIDEATSGEVILTRPSVMQADIALVDIDMPGMDGFQLTESLIKKNPSIKVLIVTMHGEPELVKKMIRIGASGYILKHTDQHLLLSAVEQVAKGRKMFDSEILLNVMNEQEKASRSRMSAMQDIPLTSREIEILKLLSEGLSNKEIADMIHISHRTVDTHRTNLMNKLGIHNIAGLIHYAYRNGLINIEE